MKTIFNILIFLMLSLLISAQNIDTNAIDEIFNAWDKDDNPGCALGIIKDGKFLYKKGYGYANLEYNMPIDEHSVFRIASTSKQFTAACIIKLVEEGKISLDDKLNSFYPEFPSYAKNITIRHLLTHTSGIRDYLTLSYLKGLGDNDHYVDEEIMKWLVNQNELNFKPGEEFIYSNSGYWLLGQIVAKASGMNMAEYAKKEIFDPLGMTETHFHNDHTKIIKNRASGYMPTSAGEFKISMTTLDMIGDGGIFTTLNDIKKWDDSYYNKTLLSENFWKLMTEKGRLNNGEELEYASGLFISEYKGLKEISHGGAFVGYRAELIRFPEEKTSIIIFANRADANPSALAYQVADVVFRDKFKATLSKDEIEEQINEKENITFISLDEKKLKEFTGHYWNEKNLLARKIYLKNDTLRYSRSETNETPLVPFSTNKFKMINVGVDVTVSFSVDSENNKTMSFSQEGRSPSISIEYTPIDYSITELKKYVGNYYSQELDIMYSLKLINEKLTLYIEEDEISTLSEVMDNVFIASRFGLLQFNKNEKGEIANYKLAVGRVKNVVFEKKD